jgi:ABC-type uncharacterized transport system auxiliary subunit
LASILAGGCASKVHELDIYTISPSPIQANCHASVYSKKSVVVSYPTGIEEAMGSRIYYTSQKYGRSYYLYSRWNSSPNRLLMATIERSLRHYGIFSHVLRYNSPAKADYTLETSIDEMVHIVSGDKSYALVEIGYTLVSTENGSVARSGRFRYEIECKTVDAKGFVQAVNEAYGRFGKDLACELSRGRSGK